MGDRLVVAVPQTSFAGGAALPVHAAVLADLGYSADPITVKEDAPLEQLAAQARALRERVARDGRLPLVACECSLVGATVSGIRDRHPDVNLVWLDAHADLNTPKTSASGLLVGMALAVALRRCLPDLLGDTPTDRVALFGARTYDAAERQAIEALDLVEAASAAEVLERLPAGPVHVHLDGDVFDLSDEPNAPFPVPGGPSAVQVGRFLTELTQTRTLVGLSVCGYAAADGTLSGAYRTALRDLLS